MYDSSGVTEVNSIDQLEHEELDLIAGDIGRVQLEILLQVIVCEFEYQV